MYYCECHVFRDGCFTSCDKPSHKFILDAATDYMLPLCSECYGQYENMYDNYVEISEQEFTDMCKCIEVHSE